MSLQYLADQESLPASSHTSPILAVRWTPHAIFSSDLGGTIKAWNTTSLSPACSLPQQHSNSVHALTTNADGTLLLASSIDGSISLWDLTRIPTRDGAVTSHQEQGGDDEMPLSTAAAEEEEVVVVVEPPVASEDVLVSHLISLASAADGVSEAWSTVLHPTAPLFASVGIGARPSLHSSAASSFGHLLSLAPARHDDTELFGTRLCLNDDGTLLAVGTATGQVFLYTLDLASDEGGGGPVLSLRTTYADHAAPVRALAFDTRGHLLVGCDDRTVTLHDVRSTVGAGEGMRRARIGGTVAALQGHRGWIMDVQPCPTSEGRIVATTSTDRSIKLWDLDISPKSCVCTCTEMEEVVCLDWQRAGSAIAVDQQQQPTATATAVGSGGGGFGQAAKFVTGGKDGRVRVYRSAGVS